MKEAREDCPKPKPSSRYFSKRLGVEDLLDQAVAEPKRD